VKLSDVSQTSLRLCLQFSKATLHPSSGRRYLPNHSGRKLSQLETSVHCFSRIHY